MDDKTKMYQGLRFEQAARAVPRRLVLTGGVLIGFTLLWWIIPSSVLYWLLVPLIGLLAWMASYGWRQALAVLRDLLDRIEQAEKGI